MNFNGAVREHNLMIATGVTTKHCIIQGPDGLANEKALFDMSVNLKSRTSAKSEDISMMNSVNNDVLAVGYMGHVIVGKALTATCTIW